MGVYKRVIIFFLHETSPLV